jgi:RNA polymerase sigma-70 factor, ECF subfamily
VHSLNPRKAASGLPAEPACPARDSTGFESLYKLHSHRVYKTCLRMVKDPARAEDLAQDTFVLLLRKLHTFRGEAAFSSWLHRLTTNVVLMSFRQKTPLWTSLENDTTDGQEPRYEIGGPDLHLSGLVDRLNLEAAIDLLPNGCRAAFILHDVEGYRHQDIARILGYSIGNSKCQLYRARKRLRELLRVPVRSNGHKEVTRRVF